MHLESITSSLRGTYHVMSIVSSSHCRRIASSLLRVRPRAACSAFVLVVWLYFFFFFVLHFFSCDSASHDALWRYALKLLNDFPFRGSSWIAVASLPSSRYFCIGEALTQNLGDAVGWGTAPQAGRSRVRFPMELTYSLPGVDSVSNRN